MVIFLRFNVCFVKFLGRKAKGVRWVQIFILDFRWPTLLIQLPFLRETVCIVKNKHSTPNLLPGRSAGKRSGHLVLPHVVIGTMETHDFLLHKAD